MGTLDRIVCWSFVVACWLNGLGLGLGLGLGQRTGNSLAVLFFLWSYKCSKQLGLVVSVSTRWFTYGFMSCG